MTIPSDRVDRPLRVLHLTAGSDAGGLSRYIFDLSSAMHAAGHQVSVAGERGAWHALFAGAAFPWIEVPLKGGPLALMAAARRLRGWFDEGGVPDVIHTHYRRPTLVARRMQAAVRRHGAGRGGVPPVLYTLHLSHISLRGPLRWLSDFGDHTHVASADARQWLVESAQVPAERVTLIPHGVDPLRFPIGDDEARRAARAKFSLPADARVAAYVGRFDSPKNEGWLIDVVEAARDHLPDLNVLLVGEGPDEPNLRARLTRGRLADRVHILPSQDPLPVYHAADALLLPSAREGFSLVSAEAMCAGRPVLRTRTSGTSELIVEGMTGRSTPIDRDAFVSAAVAFMEDRAALSAMGSAAARHVREHFTFDRQVAETVKLYRRLAWAGAGPAT